MPRHTADVSWTQKYIITNSYNYFSKWTNRKSRQGVLFFESIRTTADASPYVLMDLIGSWGSYESNIYILLWSTYRSIAAAMASETGD